MSNKGKLYLLPADFGEGSETSHWILPEVIRICRELRHFVVEEERTARRYLRRIGVQTDFDQISMTVLNEHTAEEELTGLLKPLLEGNHVGLLSEVGMPCIADPGPRLVKLAHMRNIQVLPLPGPTSILLTLVASGMNGQNFSFSGYLPVDKKARQEKIKELERESKVHNKCQLFMETPYRNVPLLEDLVKTCSPSTLLCIGSEIGSPQGWIKTKRIEEWKRSLPDIHKRTCVFALQAE